MEETREELLKRCHAAQELIMKVSDLARNATEEGDLIFDYMDELIQAEIAGRDYSEQEQNVCSSYRDLQNWVDSLPPNQRQQYFGSPDFRITSELAHMHYLDELNLHKETYDESFEEYDATLHDVEVLEQGNPGQLLAHDTFDSEPTKEGSLTGVLGPHYDVFNKSILPRVAGEEANRLHPSEKMDLFVTYTGVARSDTEQSLFRAKEHLELMIGSLYKKQYRFDLGA